MNLRKNSFKVRQINSRRKHRDGEWHHRVPDFKLVYCGPKKNLIENESKKTFLTNSISDSEKEDRQKQLITT